MLIKQLRALVTVNGWELCVLWKLNNDKRYLEWIDCCCAGAETCPLESSFAAFQCRDAMVLHSRTKACDLLEKFPLSIHIDESRHREYAETLLSNKPKYIHLSYYANSGDMELEPEVATRLLIPVYGGLAELFTVNARQGSENQHLIGYIAENCHFPLEKEESILFSDEFMNQLYNSNIDDGVLSGMFSTLIDNSNQPEGLYEFECGNTEMGPLDLNSEDETDNKYRKKNGKEPQSKNLIAERKRRKKLNERLYKLRSLVPIISKLDRASILGDAIEFVKELQKQKKHLEEELEEQENADFEYNEDPVQYLSLTEDDEPEKTEVDIRKIDGSRTRLFVKLLCEKKDGGFVRLLEVLDKQGLEVIDVNVITLGTMVSSVVLVQGKEGSMVLVDADSLKDTLLKINRN